MSKLSACNPSVMEAFCSNKKIVSSTVCDMMRRSHLVFENM
jgi:hypothetical protein